MANANRPSGFSPVGYLNGAAWNGQSRVYTIAANNGSAYSIGDPVVSSGTGDTNGVPGVVLAGGTGAILGVIIGLGKSESAAGFNPSNLDITYRPASDPGTWYAKVVDDPQVLFEIQEQSGAVQLSATDIGANTISVLGTNNGYVSGWLLASYTTATPTTTNSLQLKLLGLARRRDNAFGAYAKWLVQINVHALGHGDGSTGV